MRVTTFLYSIVALFCLFLVGCSKEAPPPSVNIQPAKVLVLGEQFRRTREIPGTVRAAQRSDLSFQVSGKIVEFSIKEGQKVTLYNKAEVCLIQLQRQVASSGSSSVRRP